MKASHFIVALVLQVLALTFGGIWGAAGAGILIGLAIGLTGSTGGFRIGFLTGLLAAALLLAVAAMRGAPITHFADMIGANFKIPGIALIAVTLLLPALQSGGLAGGIGRLLQRKA